MTPTKYENVNFRFLTEFDDPIATTGMVLVREGEMVLEVDHPDDRPYSIVAKMKGDHYAGVHEGIPGDVPVAAKWVQLDAGYVGGWYEDGQEWLFSFTLPTASEE